VTKRRQGATKASSLPARWESREARKKYSVTNCKSGALEDFQGVTKDFSGVTK
jgi:hypothetical protein